MSVMLDVFDETYNKLSPPQRTIDDVHKLGLWHKTFACWLIHPQRATIYLQLRGPRNRIDPSSYDASASGHLEIGESPEDGFRELEEELGICADTVKKQYLGIFRNIAIRSDYLNREFCHVFLAILTPNAGNFVLQQGEVDGIEEFLIADMINLLTGKVAAIQSVNSTDAKELTITKLCNWNERTTVSRYYLKVMLCAEDYISGKAVLAI